MYVDDGSRDESLDLLLELRAADDRVTVIALARNFGHQIAVTAGLDAAAGRDAVVVMDTDLQDPPEVSLQLIETWESGADVAYAQRRTRRDSAFKQGTAYVFYWMLTRLASIDIPRNVGDFRLMDRRVVAEVIRYREHDRFLRGIVAHVGFRQEAVPFDRDPRYAGSLVVPAAHDAQARRRRHPRLLDLPAAADLPAGAADLVPQRARGARSWSTSGSSSPSKAVPGWAFIAVGMFLLGGLQLLMMGVIGSYLGRVYVETQDRPLYSLAMVARGRDGEAGRRMSTHIGAARRRDRPRRPAARRPAAREVDRRDLPRRRALLHRGARACSASPAPGTASRSRSRARGMGQPSLAIYVNELFTRVRRAVGRPGRLVRRADREPGRSATS